MLYLGPKPATGDRLITYSELGSSTDITALSNATANASYPTGAYAFNALTSDGYPVDGRLTGTRNGTLHAQRLQSWTTGITYARYWINGSTAWSSWEAYIDAAGNQIVTGILTLNSSVTAASSIAKGQLITGTLTAAANNDVLVGIHINPTFTNGAFTGLSNYAIQMVGDLKIDIGSAVNGATTGHLILENSRGMKTKNAGGVVRDMFKLFSDNNFYMDNIDGDIVIRGPATANRMTMQGSNIGIATAVTPTAKMHFPGGTTTASTAPIKIDTGSLLTTPEAGAIEHTSPNFFATSETTSGRGVVSVEQQFRLTSSGSNISTIANFFGSTSNISLVASGEYEIEIEAWFTKNTAGIVTWTFTNTAAPTSMAMDYQLSAVGGIVGTAAASTLFGAQHGITSTTPTIVTGSLTNSTTHFHKIKIRLINGSGTSLKLQMTAGAGTVTPLTNSNWRVRRVPAANTGTFAA